MILDKAYCAAPIPAQQLMVVARGYQFAWIRSDAREQKRFYHFLLESQWWDTARFRAYQLENLQRVVTHAFANVPHYQDLARTTGWNPAELRRLEDLRELPVLEKQQLRTRERNFQLQGRRPLVRTTVNSSGTTGTPIRTVESRGSWARRWAFVSRLRTWAGIPNPLQSHRASFTGRTIIPPGSDPPKGPPWRRNPAANQLLLSAFHLSPETIAAYVEALNDFAPDQIDGFPSTVRTLGRLARSAGLELPRPRAIITTSETLFPEDRAVIEADFGAKVFDQFSASEPSCFWSECEHGSLHENPEYGITEILREDGTEAAPGETGDVVVTSFLNPVMPLIRYRLGDVAARSSASSCACGREMPVMSAVIGRMDDILYVPGRGYTARLDPAFKGLGGIVESQVVQTRLDAFEVLLVPDRDYSHAIGEQLVANLREKLGAVPQIEIKLVDRVPRGRNGKFRSMVSRVRHLYPDAVNGAEGGNARDPSVE